ncbi:MAG: methyltransferase domain-containing protein [Rhodospirillales bacterium]|nr:methyltransferase domain-containing protein [Rhodospirillales bacterium]
MTKKPANRTHPKFKLGPISDLESHLSRNWWNELFNSLYLKTDGDVVENESNTRNEVTKLIEVTGIKSEDRILDLCCGQGRHSMELASRGYRHVTGIDRSGYLIRLARKRARSLSLPVTFREGDARRLRQEKNPYSCIIIMGNSFGYFDSEEEDRKVLESVIRIIESQGTFVLDITDGDWMRSNYEQRSWEWIDQNYFVCRERGLSSDSDRLITREVITHAEKGVIADQFYAERLYSRDRIVELLDQAGFGDIQIQASLETNSDRNQDLGMMKNRMLLTATAPVKKAPKTSKFSSFLNVTVLLGDPRIPDSVKKDGHFNPEDFETVNRLKTALEELEGYKFKYIDNHDTLISDLGKDKSDLIFNLCDEGYKNDAFKELHIPALLEMLNVPYTGAGPACLAHCYDKSIVRAIADANEIYVPLESYYSAGDISATLPSVFPALLKPAFGDSSIGITKDAVVKTAEQLVTYLRELHETYPDCPVLVQEFLSGPEYTVGLIGNPETGLEFLPVLQVDYSNLPSGLPHILGYESKWIPESPYWTGIKYEKADLKAEDLQYLYDKSRHLFMRLGCKDYARFDFRTDDEGRIKLLEVNPNPGWCWDGKLNLMAELAGMSYGDLLENILKTACERINVQPRTVSETSIRVA